MGEVREVCSSRSGLAGAGTSGMPLADQLLSDSGSSCTATNDGSSSRSLFFGKKIEFQFKDLTAKWCMDKGFVTVFG